MSITPLQTSYKGYHFRSRTEARWAVFLDAMSIPWSYEPDGFQLTHGRYLPDFWISTPHFGDGAGYWLEIKGAKPDRYALNALRELCMRTGHHGVMVWGEIGKTYPIEVHYDGRPPTKNKSFSPEESLFWSVIRWVQHPASRRFDRVFDRAIVAARSARFEHGESGATL